MSSQADPVTGRLPKTALVVGADEDALPIEDCAREVIHLPGSIQQQGFLLAFDAVSEQVHIASANTESVFRIPLKLILGTSLDTILDREILSVARSIAGSNSEGLVSYLGAYRLQGELWSVVTHTTNGLRVLEFERLERLVVPELMNAVITNFVGKLSTLKTEIELCNAITRQVQDLTGFDRVLLYSFDDVGHGTVLSEVNNGLLPSYLDLRFPASDIPAQARQLYTTNTVRIIPNAEYKPSPLFSTTGGRVSDSFDMSYCILRSVSPVHLEYMRNMGTGSSMSISIICDGKLWGLISGHHAEPRSVPFLVRSACDMLAKIVGTQLSAFRQAARLSRVVHFHSVQRALLTEIAAESNYTQALFHSLPKLMGITEAAGTAILMQGSIQLAGLTPGREIIEQIIDWLDTQQPFEVFDTAHLGSLIPWATPHRESVSGLIAIRTSDVLRSYVLWFRPEVVQTVKWAGQPVKQIDTAARLHPRASFDLWKETRMGQSIPWTEAEIDSAREFRAALITISLKRAEESAQLSEARFQQLTHSIPALVWTADDEGHLTYVNARWRDLGIASTGCWYDILGLSQADRTEINTRWKAAVQQDRLFEGEVRVPIHNVGQRWHLVRATPFTASDGHRAGWVGTLIDTTDRHEREEALRMTEKLATTGRMTSVIAHEINNPLESITNLMYLLRGELATSSLATEYITMAESELERISGITKQTLRWARTDPDRVEQSNVRAMYDDVIRLFAGKLRNRQIHLRRLEPESIVCSGIIGQIRQVIANLLSNAIDAAPVGGEVWLDASEDAETIILSVGDNGSGMTEELLEQVFTPFFSTKGDLGNGLGLYISKEIVERHSGHLEVQSKTNGGTVVSVRLPRQARISST